MWIFEHICLFVQKSRKHQILCYICTSNFQEGNAVQCHHSPVVRVNAPPRRPPSLFLFFQFILSAAYVPRDYMAIRQPPGTTTAAASNCQTGRNIGSGGGVRANPPSDDGIVLHRATVAVGRTNGRRCQHFTHHDWYLGKKRESAAEETFCASSFSSFLIGAYSHTNGEGGVLKCWIIDKPPPSKRAREPTIVISG